MSNGADALRRNLCAIYQVPVSATDDHPEVALRALVATYGVPLVKPLTERVHYGNDILGMAGRAYAPFSPFILRLGQVLVMMEQFPYQSRDLNLSTQALVDKYKSLETQNHWLNKLGLTGGSVTAAGAAEFVKTGSVRAGAAQAAVRAGLGGTGEAIVRRVATGATTDAGLAVAVVVLVGANLASSSGAQEMQHIRAILLHRFQSGKMSNDQYRLVFGSEMDPTSIKKYWELG